MVEELIEESILLVKKLDEGDFKPSRVFWYYYEDVETWRLILSGKEFDKLLPKQEPHAYKIIAEAINHIQLTTLSISDLKLMRSDDALIKTISFLVHTDSDGFIRANFSDTTLNGIFIKEMIILRYA